MDQAMVEERFISAVEIIKNLPKSGSIHPSNETRLKFYSYFKQATEGPCELPKPGFWDVISRAKWDAWHKLGNMSKEDAMKNYVKEFIKIIEATPLNSLDDPSVVNDFMNLMGPYIEYAPEELKMKHMLMNGKGNKSLNNNSEDYDYGRSSSLDDSGNKCSDDGSDLYASPVNGHSLNGGNESDSDIFSDTLEGDDPEETFVANNPVVHSKGPNILNVRGGDNRLRTGNSSSPADASSSRGNQSTRQATGSNWPENVTSSNNLLGSAGGSRRSGGDIPTDMSSDVKEQIALAVIRMQHVMEQVVVRLDSLETLLQQRNADSSNAQVANKKSSHWSIFGMSPKLAILIFAWPFIVQFLMNYIRKKQRCQ